MATTLLFQLCFNIYFQALVLPMRHAVDWMWPARSCRFCLHVPFQTQTEACRVE